MSMFLKKLVLTLLLLTGFTFHSCFDSCGCGEYLGCYFDVQGIELKNYKYLNENHISQTSINELVSFSDYWGISADFQVIYHSLNSNHSLPGQLFACSCIGNGECGSESERLTDVVIVTLNDYDAEHLANDTINDILNFTVDTTLLQWPSISFKFTKSPELNDTIKTYIKIALSTGEIYEGTTDPIIIKN